MKEKIILGITLIFTLTASIAQNDKLPKSIDIADFNIKSNHIISLNFEYDNENRLIKMIDSTKKRNDTIVSKLSIVYNKNGRLKNYVYSKNNAIEYDVNITYVNNEIRTNSIKDSSIIKLDKYNNAIKVIYIFKSNSFFNSTTEMIYYSNGNLKQAGDFSFEYGKYKGIFSDIKMESWCKLLFIKLIPISLQKNNLIKKTDLHRDLDGNLSYIIDTSFDYEIKNDYPSKIIYNNTSYNITYTSAK